MGEIVVKTAWHWIYEYLDLVSMTPHLSIVGVHFHITGENGHTSGTEVVFDTSRVVVINDRYRTYHPFMKVR